MHAPAVRFAGPFRSTSTPARDAGVSRKRTNKLLEPYSMRWIGRVYAAVQHLNNPCATKLKTDEWPSWEVVVQFELDVIINCDTVEPAAPVPRRTAHPGRRGNERQTLLRGDIHEVFARPNRTEPRPLLRRARTRCARKRWGQDLAADTKSWTPPVEKWQPARSDLGGEYRHLRVVHAITLCQAHRLREAARQHPRAASVGRRPRHEVRYHAPTCLRRENADQGQGARRA